MLPGPVFNVELMTSARRARYFVLRGIYGLVLLIVLWQNYQANFWWRSRRPDEITISEMARFAEGLFWSFAITQAVTVLLLTPVMMAGVIADEKQRRTLHYLMASRLSSAEIVLGKLLAKLLHLAVFLGVGFPVLSLLTLFGGVAPEYIGLSYALTFSALIFVSGLSILVSTYARTVREAILVVYLLAVAWLSLPPLFEQLLRYSVPELEPWIGPINAWALATNPFALLPGSRAFAPGTSPWTMAAWMLGLQLGCGMGLIALATWRLRPVFRKQGEGPRQGTGWRARLSRPWRLLPRPALGGNPMLWKEIHVVRSGGIIRWVVRALGLIGGSVLVYWTAWYGYDAFQEFWMGVKPARSFGNPRELFNGFLRGVTGLLYCLWGLGLAAAASATVTSEKEEDTWLSLVATPLEGREILIAKMVGAAWSQRAVGAALLGLWLVGVATGAVHPLGMVVVVVEFAIFTWFIAALGVSLSLHSRNTTRATIAAVAILIVINGGYLMCCIPMGPGTVAVALGCTPMILSVSLLTYSDFRGVFAFEPNGYYGGDWVLELILTCIMGTLVYTMAAVFLTGLAWSVFDEKAGRPTQPWFDQPERPRRPELKKPPIIGPDDLA